MRSTLLFFIAAIACCCSLSAQPISFEPLPHSPQGCTDVKDIIGNANGHYYAMAKNNNYSTYFYRSLDAGTTWQKVNFGTTNLWVTPDGMLYRSNNNYFYRSADQGTSWTQLSDVSSFFSVYKMAVGPTGTLLAHTYINDMYRSTDQGNTWVGVNSPNNGNIVSMLATPDGDFYMFTTEWLGDEFVSKVYLSMDDGQTWQYKSDFPQSYYGGKIFKAASGRIFLYPNDIGDSFYYSDDQGANWTKIIQNWAGSEGVMGLIEQASGELWIATTTPRRWRSTDNGNTWTVVNPYGPGVFHDVLTNIWKMPDGTVLGDFNGALFRANDPGLNNWTPAGQGMETPSVICLKVLDDDHIYAATTGGIFKTEDGGHTWNYFYQNPIFQDDIYSNQTNFSFDNDGNVIMPDNNRLWRIEVGTGARTAIEPNTSITSYNTFLAAARLNNGQLICGTKQAAYISNDNGNTWQDFGINNSYLYFWDAHYVSDSLYILQSAYSTTYSYHPINNTLSELNSSVFNTMSVQDIFVGQSGAIHLATLSNSDHCVSYDAGASWDCVDNPNITNLTQDMAVNSVGTIFILEGFGGSSLQSSVDGGYSWNILYPDPNAPLDNANTQNIAISPSQRIFFTDRTKGIFRSVMPTTDQPLVKGRVFEDTPTNGNCDLDASEALLGQVKTQITGPGFSAVGVSKTNGEYVMPAAPGTLTAKAIPISEYWQACERTVDAAPSLVLEDIHLGLKPLVQCPKLEVELASPFLRRCFESWVYVHYCNMGTVPAPGATVAVELDPYLGFLSADAPLLAQNGQTLTFDIGDVAVNHCGYIKIQVLVSCDAPLGQVHCTRAHAYPDEDCLNNWAEPLLSSSTTCNGPELLITVQNKGGDMLAPAQYSVWGNDSGLPIGVQLLAEGEVLLAAGGSTTISLPNPSSSVFFQIDQAPGFPYGTTAGWLDATGCGVTGEPFNIFVYDDEYDWEDVLCQSNQGSFDPNDKMAFPLGIGEEAYLDPRTEIEYQIRFQNTGTDTAFNVVVRDLISPYLNLASLRPTTASHPYVLEINGRELVFRFADIMLPDSNINEPASHGFVRFAIKLLPDPPIGEDLNNQAAIYFDFNDPIWTNISHYTIGLPVISSTHEVQRPSLGLRPNPSAGELLVELPAWATQGQFTIQVQNGLGQVVHQAQHAPQSPSPLQLVGLSAGVYLVTAKDAQGRTIAAGKWVKI